MSTSDTIVDLRSVSVGADERRPMSLKSHCALICSNQSLFRTGLRLILQETGWGEVLEAPLELSPAAQPMSVLPLGIVVVDASQAWNHCLDTVSQIQQSQQCSPVLVLSANKEPRYVRAALDVGARGYVLEQASKDEFRVACLAVHQGGIYLDPQVVPRLLLDLSKPEAELRKAAILAGLSRGASNQTLAAELSLSVSSIKLCIRELFAEYGVGSRLDLLAAVGARNQFGTERF